ncbi:MAG: hypothetical protein K9L76_02700 [Candidatus Omnitrophica bacterium]|nr:hypothetical protein [Candidatus Omnitrophota bacterium]
MKSLIKRDDLELEVIHNGREVFSFEGNETIKETVKDEFFKPVTAIVSRYSNRNNIEVYGNVIKTLRPGNKRYVMYVLFKKIKNLNFEIIYNIKDRKIYEEYRQRNKKRS